ncbi:MAG: sorbosone dehydrogenase family protein [Gammaproteobacteria bacterium]|nr:MAG: sorbosone dehydrogenase family protein [Gammaproteobacteria bacterium]
MICFFWLSALFLLTGSASASLPLQTLHVPSGFSISIFSNDVDNARQMALGDQGTLFVGSRRAGNVYALVDTNQDGSADQHFIIASSLTMPSGVAFRNGTLYVAAVNKLYAFENIEANLRHPNKRVIENRLPDRRHHGWKYLKFITNEELVIPVGMPCNVCLSRKPIFGTLQRYNLKSQRFTTLATGVRNSVGFDIDPVSGEFWFTDNGRDRMGDDLPPDELNRIQHPGQHFGFPYLHGRNIPDPVFAEYKPKILHLTPPILEIQAHSAPLGMTFYSSSQAKYSFPKKYHHGIFIAEHGSWNRSRKVGYQVIFVSPDRKLDTARAEPFVTGWLNERTQQAWGRPADVLQLPDGSLLISDDRAGAIYRITHTGNR